MKPQIQWLPFKILCESYNQHNSIGKFQSELFDFQTCLSFDNQHKEVVLQ